MHFNLDSQTVGPAGRFVVREVDGGSVITSYSIHYTKLYELMLFKPQFALPLTGVYLLSGRLRVLVSFGCMVIIIYLIGTAMLGHDWVVVWFENAQWQP